MKSTFLLFITIVFIQSFIYSQGKYAGSKKSLIGQVYTDYLELPAFKGWTFMEGGVANSLSDPEMITSNVFKKEPVMWFFSASEKIPPPANSLLWMHWRLRVCKRAGQSGAVFAGKTK